MPAFANGFFLVAIVKDAVIISVFFKCLRSLFSHAIKSKH